MSLKQTHIYGAQQAGQDPPLSPLPNESRSTIRAANSDSGAPEARSAEATQKCASSTKQKVLRYWG